MTSKIFFIAATLLISLSLSKHQPMNPNDNSEQDFSIKKSSTLRSLKKKINHFMEYLRPDKEYHSNPETPYNLSKQLFHHFSHENYIDTMPLKCAAELYYFHEYLEEEKGYKIENSCQSKFKVRQGIEGSQPVTINQSIKFTHMVYWRFPKCWNHFKSIKNPRPENRKKEQNTTEESLNEHLYDFFQHLRVFDDKHKDETKEESAKRGEEVCKHHGCKVEGEYLAIYDIIRYNANIDPNGVFKFCKNVDIQPSIILSF